MMADEVDPLRSRTPPFTLLQAHTESWLPCTFVDYNNNRVVEPCTIIKGDTPLSRIQPSLNMLNLWLCFTMFGDVF